MQARLTRWGRLLLALALAAPIYCGTARAEQDRTAAGTPGRFRSTITVREARAESLTTSSASTGSGLRSRLSITDLSRSVTGNGCCSALRTVPAPSPLGAALLLGLAASLLLARRRKP